MFCLQNKKEGMVSDYSDSFVSSQNRSLYATCSSWHIDPCRFTVKCGGDIIAGQLILLPSLRVKQSTLLFKSISTRYGLEEITEKFFSTMFVTITIIYNNISSPTISTFGFAIIHSFLVF